MNDPDDRMGLSVNSSGSRSMTPGSMSRSSLSRGSLRTPGKPNGLSEEFQQSIRDHGTVSYDVAAEEFGEAEAAGADPREVHIRIPAADSLSHFCC